MTWKIAGAVTLGLFGAGVAIGYAAQSRGVPQDQIGRWVAKGVTRRLLRLADATKELMPDGSPKRLSDALTAPSPGRERA